MKYIILFLLVSGFAYTDAQTNKIITTAEYSFQVTDTNSISAMLFRDLKYILNTDGETSVITTTEFSGLNENVHMKIDGPTRLVYDIRKNLVSMDTEDKVCQYNKVDFHRTGSESVIAGYKCYSVVSKSGDTLYLSKQLPSCINPFMLNGQSISDGVVKAVLHNSGSFVLTSLSKAAKEFVVPVMNIKGRAPLTDNIFFK